VTLPERIAKVREDVAECLAIVDELFPADEASRKPDRPTTCAECGWPFARVVLSCTNFAEHGKDTR
jgi:hypothetical protein